MERADGRPFRASTRPRCEDERQRGQALAETAILAPLFALLLLVLMAWARLSIDRLALVQLTRDSAILLARNTELWNGSPSAQLQAVRRLAERQGSLDPAALSLELKALQPPFLGPLLGAQMDMDSPISGWIGSRLFGRRVILSYRIRPGGLLGRLYPSGLRLEEGVAVLGDPWTMKTSDALQRLMR